VVRWREKIQDKKCANCSKPVANRKKYCDNQCQGDHRYSAWIKEWKAGKQSGIRDKKTLTISRHLRKYLIEQAGNKCEQCGWCEVHPITKVVPLQVDHIDGDASNNREENLRVLCPNCHSLTPTYGNIGSRTSKRERNTT
jgi:5-methylcytosine-specific restriction endonuclease McrA